VTRIRFRFLRKLRKFAAENLRFLRRLDRDLHAVAADFDKMKHDVRPDPDLLPALAGENQKAKTHLKILRRLPLFAKTTSLVMVFQLTELVARSW
jgi:hypothetical protein